MGVEYPKVYLPYTQEPVLSRLLWMLSRQGPPSYKPSLGKTLATCQQQFPHIQLFLKGRTCTVVQVLAVFLFIYYY